MKIIKTPLNLIISFLLIFVFLSFAIINILSNRLLDKKYMLDKLEEIEFYEQISREVKIGFEDYIYQSGLPEDTINDLYTINDIRNDVNSIINNIYDGEEITLSDEKIKSNLREKINLFVQKENRKLDAEEENNITKFENLIANSYKNNVKVSNSLIKTARETLQKANVVYEKIKNIPLIVRNIISYFISNYKWKKKDKCINIYRNFCIISRNSFKVI